MPLHSHRIAARAPGGFFSRHIFSLDHKSIGILYLCMALFSVFLGMSLSLVIRLHLGHSPLRLPFFADSLNSSDHYAVLTLLHGSLMVFFVLTAAPQFGFGYFFLPLQIGARDMAFPFFSGISVWLTFASLAGVSYSFFVSPRRGMAIWLISVACFCAAALLSALNFCVTVIELRTRGLTLSRLPLTVWSWFIAAILSLLIFSILLAATVFLLSDRFATTHFFRLSADQGTPAALWTRWFWFFAQSEVYVAILPCFGVVSHLLAIFARKRVWAERMAVLALCGVGLAGFCVWGYHMFAAGLNPYAPMAFSELAASLGIPAAFLIATWIGTLWGTKPQLNTAMLFTLGFISLFLSGATSGLALFWRGGGIAQSTNSVTGHFHLVMGVASTFAVLGALFFWFPKMFGRQMNERLGKVHFWFTFVGAYSIFMPMHWLGLLDYPNAAPFFVIQRAAKIEFALRTFIAVAAITTIAAQLIFFVNFFWSVCRREKPGVRNPWRATTLEWFVPSPPPRDNFGVSEPIVYRGAYFFGVPLAIADFLPQHLAPERIARYSS